MGSGVLRIQGMEGSLCSFVHDKKLSPVAADGDEKHEMV